LRELERFAEASRRYLPKASMRYVEAVDALVRRFPNFSEVIGPIRRALHLQIRTGGAVHFRPQLLLGAPGVGKTAFVRSLAEALGATFVFQSLAELSAGFIINGNNVRWNNSSPGLIANAICSLPPGKPLLVLFDELDKVHVNSNYPPDGVLLGLLEPATAARFQDEYLQIPMDVSKVMFVFTANRISGVRPELLSRMKQTLIPAPRPEDMPAVVRSVDEAIRADQPAFNDLFAPLSDEVIAALALATPRQVYRALEEAYAAACEQAPSDCARIEITAAVMPNVESAKDLPVAAPQRRDWPLLLPEPASKWPN
jgi:ATP-dependent Lon protease, bacterial type